MGRWSVIVVTAAFVVAGRSDPARAEEASPQLHVRVYDNTQLPRRQLAAVLVGASRLLAPVGIEVYWHTCSPAARVSTESVRQPERSASCDEPLARGELALRIVHAEMPSTYRGRLPLGDSLVDRDLGLGVLATIYYERVEWLAREANVPMSPLLSRTIAHELAHLLLGNAEHAASGLMRPAWSRQELRRNRAKDWRFTSADADAIRERRKQAAAALVE